MCLKTFRQRSGGILSYTVFDQHCAEYGSLIWVSGSGSVSLDGPYLHEAEVWSWSLSLWAARPSTRCIQTMVGNEWDWVCGWIENSSWWSKFFQVPWQTRKSKYPWCRGRWSVAQDCYLPGRETADRWPTAAQQAGEHRNSTIHVL